MTVFSDKLKQVEELEEKLSIANACLMGHNGDCFCDFCEDDDTKMLKNKVDELYGQVIIIRKKLTGEED